MYSRRLVLVFTFVLLLSLTLTGCSARPGQGTLAANATSDQLVVDVPALTIEFNDQGEAMMGGANLSQVLPALGVALPDALNFSPEEIKQLTDAGVQNVFIDVAPDGFTWYINGQPLPALKWDAETLASLQKIVAIVGADNADTLGTVVPLLGNMSLGVELRFPGAAADAPLVGTVDQAAIKQASTDAFNQALTGLGHPTLRRGLPSSIAAADHQLCGGRQSRAGGSPAHAHGLPAARRAGRVEPNTRGVEARHRPRHRVDHGQDLARDAQPGDQRQRPATHHLGQRRVHEPDRPGHRQRLVEQADRRRLGALEQINQFLPILQNSKIDLTVNFAKP